MSRRYLNQRGFGLLQLSIILVIAGGLLSIFLSLTPGKQLETQLDTGLGVIDTAREALTGFVIQSSTIATPSTRLPCPDIDGNGEEGSGTAPAVCNAADVVGALPWVTMGLPGPVLDSTSTPLRYAVYRNTGTADLTNPGNSFFLPADHTRTFPDVRLPVLSLDAGNINLYDFCKTLSDAKTAAAAAFVAGTVAADTNYSDAGTARNSAYVLASGGVADSDASGSAFDSPNAGIAFGDPAEGRSSSYDDMVSPRQFAELQREFSCSSLLMAMNYFIDVYNDAIGAEDGAFEASVFADIQALIDVISAFNAGLELANAIISLATATTTAATATACAAGSLGLAVNCTVAVVLAGLTIIAAGTMIVVSGAALLLAVVSAAASVASAVIANVAWLTAVKHREDVGTSLQAADARGGLR